jgi:cobalt transporter subunit CbtA
LPRFFYTSLTTIATAVGVAFLLLAGMIFAGDPIDERHALAWSIAGFVASGLAPAAGLAPELPGGAAGELVARQIWWIGTAAATALALWAFLRMENPIARGGAVILLVAPHVIGAPHAHAFESKVPAEVAAQFAALSLIVQGLLWAFAGIAVGLLWPKFAPKPASRHVAS